MEIPTQMEELVDEISHFTGLERNEVKDRVWREAIELGWNVCQDAKKFGITPHHYDTKMEELYRNSDGFIFETMVYWARSGREYFIQQTLERIQLYASRKGKKNCELKILLLGDGTGNDSLYLVMSGFQVDYFDFPGSKVYDFVTKRFKHYGILENGINIITNYDACLAGEYDVIVSFEVLEHLPDPLKAIFDIRSMLKIGGIALITEAFADLTDNLPTHLESNRKFKGKTPFRFLKHGMVLSWYAPFFKPMEFTKQEEGSLKDYFFIWKDRNVIVEYISGRLGILKQFVKHILSSTD